VLLLVFSFSDMAPEYSHEALEHGQTSTSKVDGYPNRPPGHRTDRANFSGNNQSSVGPTQPPPTRATRQPRTYARALLSEGIRLIYEQLPDILPLDQPAITQCITLQDRLQQPTKRLRHWLLHVRPIFKTSLQQATERPPHTMDIRTFFHTGRPPEPPG
jgi:hypothetical protein